MEQQGWPADGQGVLTLPSGRRIRGRGVRRPLPDGPAPTYAVHLLGRRPPVVPWPSTWVRWPDFGLPTDPRRARRILLDAWERAEHERVEVACGGGRGRTGTALACLAVLDGLTPEDAVSLVRAHHAPGAVETPWQRWFVRWFAAWTTAGSP